ncbi:unnamed protein product [Adineta steineri]|uniref:Ricin B lectin domain-containing protein n=1 Tax=Adineta steineri TaxID=433720 RepID=A0A819RHX0_9BILA|nr:unnamed protein product [Adineta steineri]
MVSQWFVVLILLPFLQLAFTRIISLDEHFDGEDVKEDRFGIATSYVYRLTNKYLGPDLTFVSIVGYMEDGVKMDSIQGLGSEYWHFIRLGDNKYRIQNFVDDRTALDIHNDKMKNKVHMSKIGDFSGQYWHLTHLKDGSFRLSNDFSGRNMALDVVGRTHNLTMSTTAVDYLGQHWIFTKAGKYLKD